MKKIYLKPETTSVDSEFEISLMVPSLDPSNPGTDLPNQPGNGGQGPGEGDDEEWGGAKGRNIWSNDLW